MVESATTDNHRRVILSRLVMQSICLDCKLVKAEKDGDEEAIIKYKFQKKATSVGIVRILETIEAGF